MFTSFCGKEEDHVSHRYWINDGADMGSTEYTCNGYGIFKI
ncbi:hypothetical protein FDH59_gp43 [Arthrobacter phage Joann]|uniref:Uncharacterized protein n=1 Tax=Arthrobacter phage Joann TaxID=1772303 RepID=A0A0U4IF33_9CAUD|nr:hypothetical protein FDH59_gp43 [Arthrobacter phage Joann]ALY09446.1 hypothetical protein JOANN_43 [Arthrobacter phage Joann]